ncbi:MAG: DUF1801 domain-containing protein, partial [Ginsengibacter sp.]
NIDTYIARFPEVVQKTLEQVRLTVRKAASNAEETISYGMPAFRYNGRVIIYFAGYKNHIGLYATPSGHAAFEKELSAYKQGRGSVQFPLDKPMPLSLISRIVNFRVQQQDEKPGSFPATISAPAKRALENNGIKTLQQLSKHTEADILKFHGIGKTAIPILQKALKEKGLSFKNSKEVLKK